MTFVSFFFSYISSRAFFSIISLYFLALIYSSRVGSSRLISNDKSSLLVSFLCLTGLDFIEWDGYNLVIEASECIFFILALVFNRVEDLDFRFVFSSNPTLSLSYIYGRNLSSASVWSSLINLIAFYLTDSEFINIFNGELECINQRVY